MWNAWQANILSATEGTHQKNALNHENNAWMKSVDVIFTTSDVIILKTGFF